MVEHGQRERLALRVRSQVGLKAERIDGRNERLHRVQRAAGNRRILRHVTSTGEKTKILPPFMKKNEKVFK